MQTLTMKMNMKTIGMGMIMIETGNQLGLVIAAGDFHTITHFTIDLVPTDLVALDLADIDQTFTIDVDTTQD